MPFAINQLMESSKFLTVEELIELNQFIVNRIKHERSRKAMLLKHRLSIGTVVKFDDGRGNTIQGSVSKIMRKFAKVNSGGSVWRVPIGVLEVV